MIRTIAAVAALAAVPALATAQPNYSTYDDHVVVSDELTVQGQLPDRYTIRLNVAGKDSREVYREIADAAQTACMRAPLTNAADMHVDSMHACVTRAEFMASRQYDRLLNGRYITRVDYEDFDY